MRSIDSLTRRLDNLEKRLPADDVEFEVLGFDDEGPDGDDVIVIDLVGASRALQKEIDDEHE